MPTRPIAVLAAAVIAASAGLAGPAAAAAKVRTLLTVDGTHSWDRKEPHFRSLAAGAGEFELTETGDLDRWLPESLKEFDLVVIHTTGGTLTAAQANGLKAFVEAGGGVVGIHSATDSFHDSDTYFELLGGRFVGHGGGRYDVEVIDPHHPVVAGTTGYAIDDEDYQHRYHPKAGIRVLARKRGDDRNMVWVKRAGKGRVFYIANGDNPGVFENRDFRRILLAGMRWAAGRRVPPPAAEEGFAPLFDGKGLDGWEGDRKLWLVEDGEIVGRSPGIDRNEFLFAPEEHGDFDLRLQFRVLRGEGNSGVQVRSARLPDGHASGYQADLADGMWGNLYDEARRKRNLAAAPREALRVLEADGWNDYEISCRGDRTVVRLNGLVTADWVETDPAIPRRGRIALQVHAGGPMEVRFGAIRIRRH